MHEPFWQPLVGAALVRCLGLRADAMLAEVQTRDGSILDLLYIDRNRLVGFELKVAEPGGVAVPIDRRAQRQLRHYTEACDAVWLVTLAGPRGYTILPDLRVVVEEPHERQLLPPGVGWIVFDRVSHDVTPVVPAPELTPSRDARLELCDRVLARLGRVVSAAKECRA